VVFTPSGGIRDESVCSVTAPSFPRILFLVRFDQAGVSGRG